MARFGDREHMKFPTYLLSLLLCYQTNPVGLHVKPRFYVPCHKTFPYSTHALAISQFLDAKIRLRNRAEPGTFGGVWARSRLNYEPGILGGGMTTTSAHHR